MYCNDENEVVSELNKVQGKSTENQFTVKKDPERGPFFKTIGKYKFWAFTFSIVLREETNFAT